MKITHHLHNTWMCSHRKNKLGQKLPHTGTPFCVNTLACMILNIHSHHQSGSTRAQIPLTLLPSLLVSFLESTQCPFIADKCKFLLVGHIFLDVRVYRRISLRNFFLLLRFARLDLNSLKTAVCSILVKFAFSFFCKHLIKLCNHTMVFTRQLLWRICILFY